MKILAIKGDKERGDEVIALLEMLGGKNKLELKGLDEAPYFIESDNYILCNWVANINYNKYQVFTLDEFYEKYPYKVGDVVKTGTDEEGIIKQIKWVNNDIVYWVESNKTCKWAQTLSVDVLDKYNRLKSNDIEHIWATTVESNKRDREDVLFDSIIWHLRNSVNNGKQHLSGGDCEAYFRELVKKVKMKEKKPVYPKTYKECCKIMYGIAHEMHLQYDTRPSYKFEEDLRDLLENLRKLIICRNAYWKIAGEQMGLDKPWEPDFGKSILFCINYYLYQNEFLLYQGQYDNSHNRILVFPTEEMRDIFYENFKDLIEKCKELL